MCYFTNPNKFTNRNGLCLHRYRTVRISEGVLYCTVHNLTLFLVEREKRVACIRITDGAIGYSYGSLFGEYLNKTVEKIEIDDPYIRASHQVSDQ